MGDDSTRVLSGRWHLQRELGRGGAAVVFEAEDRFDLDRPVALKVAIGNDPSTQRALHRELELLYGIRHPNLVATLALGTLRPDELEGFQTGAPFLVQELGQGRSARARTGSADDETLAFIGAQISAGLSALHAREIRHNDVTPANVLLSDSGDARLIDFGLASSGPIGTAGTLRYMAPEAMAGRSVPASDLYGLAATLAHLHAGAPPRGPHGATLELDRESTLAELIRDMSAVNPDRRPSAAQSFERFSERVHTPHRAARLAALRDQTLVSTRYDHPRAGRAIDGLGDGTRLMVIGGPPRSGRSAVLHGAVARAVGRGLRVLGAEPLPAERVLQALVEDLQLGGWPNTDVALFEAIRAALERDGRPALLAIDDLERDARAEAFVRYLERTAERPPGLLVATVSQARRSDLETEVLDLPSVERLLRQLRPLRPTDTHASPALLRASEGRLGPLVRALNRYPGDALVEAAQTAALEIPAEDRGIPPGLEEAARRLAPIADVLSPERLQSLGVSREDAIALRRAGLLHLHGTALYSSTRLRSRPASATAIDPALFPLTCAITAPESHVDRLVTAAKEAEREHRIEAAMDLYGLVLPHAVDDGPRISLARLLGARGRHEEALAVLDGTSTPEASLQRATHLHALARYREAARTAPVESTTLREEAEALRARSHLLARDYDEAQKLCASALARDAEHAYRAELIDTLGMVELYAGDSGEARRLLEEAMRAAEPLEEAARRDRVRSHLAVALHKTGALNEAETTYRKAMAGARENGDFQNELLRQVNLATVLQERGKWSEALEGYERAHELARIIGDDRTQIRNALNHANLLGWLGEHERATTIAHEARRRAGALEMTTDDGYLALLEAEQRVALARDAAPLIQNARERIGDNPVGRAECDLVEAQAALRAGHRTEAHALALGAVQTARESQREALELISATWCLLSAPSERDITLESLGRRAQALAAERSDPDHGWLLAIARSEIAPPEEKAQLLNAARTLATDARARLSAERERSYAAVWYRAPHWTAVRSLPTPTAELTRDFDRLLAINRELARDHDPERLLDRIVDAAIALSGAERGFIVLCPTDTTAFDENALTIHVGRSLDRESLSGERLSRSIAARAIESAAPVTTVDASGDARFKEALSVHELKLRSVLCLPLRTHRRAIGALYLDNRYRAHAFSDADVQLLAAFGDQAAIALANARLVAELGGQARELERMKAEVEVLNQRLERELDARTEELRHAKRDHGEQAPVSRYGMIGRCEAMQRVYRIIDRVADKDVTVTILGESGTGKELVARALHDASATRSGPFVPLNCGAIPEQLLESELFGHERGAFTGAVRSKPGLFEVASEGTLFLDEIGDMPMSMQVKLLRVLQQREYRRVGGTATHATHARVVAATHRDLEAQVREGSFREDLWYRLNVVEIRVPALRERDEDVAVLIDHFLTRAGFADRIERRARAVLLDYAWPGNIRELENELQRATALATERITVDDLSDKLRTSRGAPRRGPGAGEQSLKGRVEAYERELIAAALERADGTVAAAARHLGLTRAGLYKKLHKYGLHVDKR